jgi:hypothetical protein
MMFPEQVGQQVFPPVEDYGRDWVKALGLTQQQVTAILRLQRRMVWADGRSVRALVNKQLAVVRGGGRDALIGEWRCIMLTDFGREVAAWLKQNDYAEGAAHRVRRAA